MTLALVRRRSLSETRGIGDECEVEVEVELGVGVEVALEAEVGVEVEVEVERVGAAIRGMGNFLGSRSDTAPSGAGESNRRPTHPGRRQAAAPTRRRSTWRRDEKFRDWATMCSKLAKRPTAAQTATDGRDGRERQTDGRDGRPACELDVLASVTGITSYPV
ncbi:hypothetical protein AB5J55_14335 [Streptomyces sp. R11]|uniref:Uncharacterized protein n=1 Tax=Streptomyces sp. R11 TaxID=3238625 RepID=A0AB39NFU7_9ACTN